MLSSMGVDADVLLIQKEFVQNSRPKLQKLNARYMFFCSYVCLVMVAFVFLGFRGSTIILFKGQVLKY